MAFEENRMILSEGADSVVVKCTWPSLTPFKDVIAFSVRMQEESMLMQQNGAGTRLPLRQSPEEWHFMIYKVTAEELGWRPDFSQWKKTEVNVSS